MAYATPKTLEQYFEHGGTFASIDEIDFREVERRRREPGVTVVDVRFASEFEAGHVPGAVNASYTRLPDYEQDRIPSGQTLLVHCASGARSAAAAAYLARAGYDLQYVSDDFASYREIGKVEEGRLATA